jgi:hypothetical protein
MRKRTIYVYPKFDSFLDIGIRIGGFGLSNCLFVISRAIIIANENNYTLINPTWERIGLGQYIRREKDKRNYFGLFKKTGVKGLKKYLLIYLGKKLDSINQYSEKSILPQIIVVKGLSDYFESLLPYQGMIKQWILDNTKTKSIINECDNYIGIHIRMGDYSQERRAPVEWYIDKILEVKNITQNRSEFMLFSDGTDEELKDILKIDGVYKCYAGNALADILSLSNCCFIIGSDSTFSGWAAFLGQKPAVFPKKHFGKVLINQENEVVLNNEDDFPTNIKNYLENKYNIKATT